MEAGAREIIAATLGAGAAVRAARTADLRFAGQGAALVTPLPAGPYGPASLGTIRAAFEAAYRVVFAGVPPVASVEIVNIRVAVAAATGDGRLDPGLLAAHPGAAQGTRSASCQGEMRDLPVFRRDALAVGQTIDGPALVEDGMSTLPLPPGYRAILEACGNLVVALPA